MIRYFKISGSNRNLRLLLTLWLLIAVPAGLLAQSFSSGLMYTSYLPFTSLYNKLTAENKAIGQDAVETDGFRLAGKAITHYAPGGAWTSAYAFSGLLTTLDLGLMAGPGRGNIIPDFPVRPFIALNFGYSFVRAGMLRVYGMGGFYFDLALGKGKRGYDFFHFLGFFRLGPGVSLKIVKLEIFAQFQFGIGIQMERIGLESKAGNKIYEATFLMVPIALFPELGIRFWL